MPKHAAAVIRALALGAAVAGVLSGCVGPPEEPAPWNNEALRSIELDATGITVHSEQDSQLTRVTYDAGGVVVLDFLKGYLGPSEDEVLLGCTVATETYSWPRLGIQVRWQPYPASDALGEVMVIAKVPDDGLSIRVTTNVGLSLGDEQPDLWPDGGSILYDPAIVEGTAMPYGAFAFVSGDAIVSQLRAPTWDAEPGC